MLRAYPQGYHAMPTPFLVGMKALNISSRGPMRLEGCFVAKKMADAVHPILSRILPPSGDISMHCYKLEGDRVTSPCPTLCTNLYWYKLQYNTLLHLNPTCCAVSVRSSVGTFIHWP